MNGARKDTPAVRFRTFRIEVPSALLFASLAAGIVVARAWLPDILGWLPQAAAGEPVAMRLRWSFDAVAGFVLMGFVLPKLWGYGARKRHAEKWKADELGKWGFHSRDRQGPMNNYIYYPVVHRSDVAKGKNFYSEWLIIHDGCIIVNPGESIVNRDAKMVAYDFGARKTYAWDGCTPKAHFWWLAVIGTPDWAYGNRTVREVDVTGRIVDRTVVWPLAHHASLVHDALCQYIDHIPVKRSEVNTLFRQMLLEAGMWRPAAWLYYGGVCIGSARPACGITKTDTGKWHALLGLERGGCVSGGGSG